MIEETPKVQVSLSDAIEELRNELMLAQKAGKGKALSFTISEIELELRVALTRTGEGGLKLGWGIVEASGGGSQSTERTHRLLLKMDLTPDEDGKPRQIGDREAPPEE